MGRNNAAEIRAEIERQIRESAEVDAGLNAFMENEVIPYLKSQHPVDSGHIAAQVKITKRARHGKGRIGNKSSLAHLIEYGTKGDTEGDDSRVVNIDGEFVTIGKDTPSPEFAPMAKTAKHFGGNLEGGISEPDE